MLKKIKCYGWQSSGCTAILSFDNKKIRLDCGCEVDEEDLYVDEMYLSHEHCDHLLIKELNKVQKANDKVSIYTESDYIIPHSKGMNFNEYISNYGYFIEEEGVKIGFFTDIGSISPLLSKLDFSKLDFLFVECNYDEVVMHYKENKNYKDLRVISDGGHLGNLTCLKWLLECNLNKNCTVFFIHESSDNDDEHGNQYPHIYDLFNSLPQKWFVMKGKKTYLINSQGLVKESHR